MRTATFYFAGLIGMLLCAREVLGQTRTGWTLVWSDEFSQADGSPPDSTKWVFETGAGGWGNNELEYYTSRTNNIRVEGGNLVIEAKKENYAGASYTSARIKTLGKASWAYGRIEARIKIPRGQGIWPAFWMMGTNVASAGWPKCGEIDIMENIGKEPTLVHGTVHGPGYSGDKGIGGPCSLPGGGAFADDFHIYAVEWTTNQLKWFVDGLQYFSVTPARLPGGTNWVFTQAQFILLNVAVGGYWPGNPDGTTSFPQKMLIDYVRVYRPTNLSACGPNLLGNPGFESAGLTGWTTYGAGGNTQVASIKSLPVREGSNSFKVYGQFNGSVNYSGVFQDLAAEPGQSFAAKGWVLTPSADAIGAANIAWIEVSFRDTSAHTIGLYRSAVVNSNTAAGLWFNLSVTNQYNPTTFALFGSVNNLVAPAGTSAARFQMVFRQQANAGGSVLFDDLSITSGLPAAVPVPTGIAAAGASLTLSFPTYLGLPYQVLWIDDLKDTTWQLMTNIVGNGSKQTIFDVATAPQRFYQAVEVCD